MPASTPFCHLKIFFMDWIAAYYLSLSVERLLRVLESLVIVLCPQTRKHVSIISIKSLPVRTNIRKKLNGKTLDVINPS